jgi:hypothetical protein
MRKKKIVHQISLDHDIKTKEELWINNSKQMGFDSEVWEVELIQSFVA